MVVVQTTRWGFNNIASFHFAWKLSFRFWLAFDAVTLRYKCTCLWSRCCNIISSFTFGRTVTCFWCFRCLWYLYLRYKWYRRGCRLTSIYDTLILLHGHQLFMVMSDLIFFSRYIPINKSASTALFASALTPGMVGSTVQQMGTRAGVGVVVTDLVRVLFFQHL